MFNENFYKALEHVLKGVPSTNIALINTDGTSQNVSPISYTNNYVKIFPAFGKINSNTPPQQVDNCSGSLIYINNGTTIYFGTGSYPVSSMQQYYGVWLGDGDTAPAYDDYTLSGNRITDFSATTGVATAITSNGIKVTGTYVITNTGAAAITIREIALTAAFGTFNGATQTTPFMIERTVLSSPVIIQPGDNATLQYTLNFNL